MSEQRRCERFGKIIGGCRFEPRYDKGPVQLPDGFALNYIGGSLGERLEQHRKITYLGDACVRCGKFILYSVPRESS